jgi:hypothetical protein
MDDSIQTLNNNTTGGGDGNSHNNKSEGPNYLTSIAGTEFPNPSNAGDYSEKKNNDEDKISVLYDLEECAESYVE